MLHSHTLIGCWVPNMHKVSKTALVELIVISLDHCPSARREGEEVGCLVCVCVWLGGRGHLLWTQQRLACYSQMTCSCVCLSVCLLCHCPNPVYSDTICRWMCHLIFVLHVVTWSNRVGHHICSPHSHSSDCWGDVWPQPSIHWSWSHRWTQRWYSRTVALLPQVLGGLVTDTELVSGWVLNCWFGWWVWYIINFIS